MKARVVVKEAGAALPHAQADYDAMATEQYAALIETGRAAIAEYGKAKATPRDNGTTLWEVAAGTGAGQAQPMLVLPGELEIKTGDTVRWVNYSVTEPHAVTFLGGEEQPEDVMVEPQADGPPKFVHNPATLFPAGGPVCRGKGYVNSGVMGEGFRGVDPFELTFDTAGDYPYYCALHASGPEGPGMAGWIKVAAR
jgi:plastocyanin